MSKSSKRGSVRERNGKFHLSIMIDGTRAQMPIKDDLGRTVTDKKSANAFREKTAQLLLAKIQGIGEDSVELGELENVYRKHLPNYSKRKGKAHVEATKTTRVAPRTLRTNLGYLRAFVQFMHDTHKRVKKLSQVTQVHASGFMATKAEFKASTYNRALMSLRHVFDVIPHGDNPFSGIDQRSKMEVDGETAAKRPFTTPELSIMQKKATGWIRPAMFIGFHTGLRLGDVVTLRWDEISADGFFTKVQRKTGKAMPIYAPEALPAVEEWRKTQVQPGEYVFPEQSASYLGQGKLARRNRDGETERTSRDTSVAPKQFMRFLRDTCGFNVADDNGNTVLGFHSLRVSNATYGSNVGEPVENIQARLAHSSETTTSGYIQTSEEDLKRQLVSNHIPLGKPGTVEVLEDDDRQLRLEAVRIIQTASAEKIRRAVELLRD